MAYHGVMVENFHAFQMSRIRRCTTITTLLHCKRCRSEVVYAVPLPCDEAELATPDMDAIQNSQQRSMENPCDTGCNISCRILYCKIEIFDFGQLQAIAKYWCQQSASHDAVSQPKCIKFALFATAMHGLDNGRTVSHRMHFCF